MPFEKPDLSTLVDAVETDIEARLPGADARLRRSNLNVMARVLAGAGHGLYGFIDWAKNQHLVDTAEAEMLDRHGQVWKIDRIAATFAQGNANFAGSDGSVIPAGTGLQRSDGVEYTTDTEVAIVAGSATVAITATAAALGGNATAASAVNLISPIAGIDSGATVAVGGLTGGTDEENDAAFRARILDRIQAPPHGGADFDYVKWAKDQAGVTRAWVYPQELGLGTVTVRFMMDDTYGDGLPLVADVATVQTALDAERPVTADLTLVAPVAKLLAPEISGLNPVTQAVKDAIEAELKDLIRREAEPGSTLLISHIREAISIAAGEADHALVSPVADVTHANGEIAVFDSITWS